MAFLLEFHNLGRKADRQLVYTEILQLANMENLAKNEDEQNALRWSCQLCGIATKQDFDYQELKKALTNFLNTLITEDFNKLISILYRIDVSQEKATAALSTKPNTESTGSVLAELIITRQLQKIKTRRKYKT